MSTQGSESSFGLQTNPIQRTTNCSCLRGLPMHEEMKTRTLPLLGLSGAPGRSRQWHHSYPGPVLRPWGLFSSFSIFQFLSCSRNIAVTRKGPWKESKHCPQAIQIALLEGLNWPCSYKSAVWPVLPAKGLGLPQAGPGPPALPQPHSPHFLWAIQDSQRRVQAQPGLAPLLQSSREKTVSEEQAGGGQMAGQCLMGLDTLGNVVKAGKEDNICDCRSPQQ
jgi:hypothetical protein